MIQLIIFLSLFAIAYFSGRYFEKVHYKSILEREKEYLHLPVIAGDWKDQYDETYEGTLLSAGIVVGSDYFKTTVSGVRSLFGGRLKDYESLLDRGRREATLRLQSKAAKWGAEKILNLRLESSSMGMSRGGNSGLPSVEIFAYGTAVKKRP